MFVLIAISVAIVCIAAVAVSTILAVRRGQKLETVLGEQKERPSLQSIILEYLWPIGGAVIGGFKFVYKAWREAPPDSTPKLYWGILLAAMIAVLCWLVVYIIDMKLNGSRKTFTQMLWTPEESNERPA